MKLIEITSMLFFLGMIGTLSGALLYKGENLGVRRFQVIISTLILYVFARTEVVQNSKYEIFDAVLMNIAVLLLSFGVIWQARHKSSYMFLLMSLLFPVLSIYNTLLSSSGNGIFSFWQY